MIKKDKILIIDDDGYIAKTIESMLNTKYHVDSALSGQKGMAMLKNGDYAVALLDIRLQDISGVDILKRMKRDKLTTEIVMLTGNQDMDVALDTMNSGAAGYVSKPFSYEFLHSCVLKALVKYKINARMKNREVPLSMA